MRKSMYNGEGLIGEQGFWITGKIECVLAL